MDYYVYLHRKATTGEVFYVGKGCKNRAWSSVGRSRLWKYTANKHGYTVEIYQDCLQEWYAFELEVDLILKYGRIDLGTGTLCNLHQGGTGSGGENNSNADRTQYTFINVKTKEERTCTRTHLKIHCPKVRTSALICGTINVSADWALKEKYDSAPNLEQFIKPKTGEFHWMADNTEYSVTNLVTGETVSGTKRKLKELLDINAYEFTKRRSIVVGGWCLTENLSKALNSSKEDFHIYEFVHKTGERFRGTRAEFRKEKGFEIKRLFSVATPVRSVRGWCLLGKENDSRASHLADPKTYHFVHESGKEFIGIRIEFTKLMGHDPAPLFKKNPAKQSKGWRLLPSANK